MKQTIHTITELAYGKINLYLDVFGKRPDGYHEIQSIMHTVSLCDTVTVTKTETECRMTCTDPTLTCGEDNLCLRAAHTFFAALATTGGCDIHLEKTLPREAGLGGGSADAAAVLRALNRLYDRPFSVEDLRQMAARIGADVPFCVTGGAAYAEGIGERLRPCHVLPDGYLVISGGIGRMSTPEAYRRIDEIVPTRHGDLIKLSTALAEGNWRAIGQALYNRFEDAVPSSQAVKELLLSCDAVGALMTGSGTAVFGLFEKKETAERACQILREKTLTAFLATPIGRIS
ncbi:MAG: 4-(cytidine 5'-diphospho)-2-C-methyl-D-erythritol kinase [Ruminococcaceae bacterium]|nr:4-(cytidine 5'-diphospho)-2-C-methyl-D-erythritol kinase [Oscillospiraceae bacterium]